MIPIVGVILYRVVKGDHPIALSRPKGKLSIRFNTPDNSTNNQNNWHKRKEPMTLSHNQDEPDFTVRTVVNLLAERYKVNLHRYRIVLYEEDTNRCLNVDLDAPIQNYARLTVSIESINKDSNRESTREEGGVEGMESYNAEIDEENEVMESYLLAVDAHDHHGHDTSKGKAEAGMLSCSGGKTDLFSQIKLTSPVHPESVVGAMEVADKSFVITTERNVIHQHDSQVPSSFAFQEEPSEAIFPSFDRICALSGKEYPLGIASFSRDICPLCEQEIDLSGGASVEMQCCLARCCRQCYWYVRSQFFHDDYNKRNKERKGGQSCMVCGALGNVEEGVCEGKFSEIKEEIRGRNGLKKEYDKEEELERAWGEKYQKKNRNEESNHENVEGLKKVKFEKEIEDGKLQNVDNSLYNNAKERYRGEEIKSDFFSSSDSDDDDLWGDNNGGTLNF